MRLVWEQKGEGSGVVALKDIYNAEYPIQDQMFSIINGPLLALFLLSHKRIILFFCFWDFKTWKYNGH